MHIRHILYITILLIGKSIHAFELGLGVHTGIELAHSSLQAQSHKRKVAVDANFNSIQPAWHIGLSTYLAVQPWLFIQPSLKTSLFRHVRSNGETALTHNFQFDISSNLKIGYWFLGTGVGVGLHLPPRFLPGFPTQGEKTKSYISAILLLQTGVIFPVNTSKNHHITLNFSANFDIRSFATKSLTLDQIHSSFQHTTKFSLASPITLSLSVGYLFIF